MILEWQRFARLGRRGYIYPMAEIRLPLQYLPETLGDGIIVLDAHRIADAEEHLLGEDEEMRRRFDAVRPATLAETRRAMARWIAGRDAGHPMFAYALRDPSGRLIGGCELRVHSADSANISYWVFPAFRGSGFALRAVNLLCAAAEKIPGLRRLELRVTPDNQSSLRVARKAGFSEAGMADNEAGSENFSTMLLYVKEMRGS